MEIPAIPRNEDTRIRALHALDLLDTPAEESYDRITRLAMALFSVPIALVSLVDSNRQWFKSCQGLDAGETRRDISFCGHAILNDKPFVINDASRDERFADNPLVTGEPRIRFYAGRPLKTLDGSLVGTLCIIDTEARQINADEIASLNDLGALVEKEFHAIELTSRVECQHQALIEAKNQAEHANNEKSRFLANMSHELRTPLHSILSFTNLALKRVVDSKSERFLNNIKTSAHRLTLLVDALLDLAKLEKGGMPLDLQYRDFSRLVNDSIYEVSSLLMQKSMVIEFDREFQHDAVFDRHLMNQVIVNLLSNAIKFSPQGGKIVISINSLKSHDDSCFQGLLELVVADEGIGVPESELRSIFNRFEQSSKSVSRAGGTGLGLAICQEIIHAHKGAIWARSPVSDDNRGTAIHVMIPKTNRKNPDCVMELMKGRQ